MASRELGADESPPREKELWLLGFRIKVAGPGDEEREAEDDGSMRKSWSMGDLATPVSAGLEEATRDCGYLSEGGLYQPAAKNGRKRGIPWTEEEHRTFLKGLEKLGKGDWRGISRNFVRTRTPTQVASHAQKYFLRQMNPHKRKRRFSLFDVAMDNNDQVLTPHSAFSSRSIPGINEKEHFAQDDTTLIDQVPLFSSHDISPSRKKMMIGSCSFIDQRNINCKVEATSSAQVQAAFIESKLLPPIQAVRSSEQLVEGTGTSNASLQPLMHWPNILEPTVGMTQRKFVVKDASFLQCSDLELRIGLPQPNLAARLPSPSASGTVGVS